MPRSLKRVCRMARATEGESTGMAKMSRKVPVPGVSWRQTSVRPSAVSATSKIPHDLGA